MSTLRFTPEHEWLRLEASGELTVGITDFAQQALGDVVFVQVPELGVFEAGHEVAVLESVKAASTIAMPLTGEVVAVNQALADDPHQLLLQARQLRSHGRKLGVRHFADVGGSQRNRLAAVHARPQCVQPDQFGQESLLRIEDRLRNRPHLRLVGPGGRARGRGGTAEAGGRPDVGFDRRVAARVENPP